MSLKRSMATRQEAGEREFHDVLDALDASLALDSRADRCCLFMIEMCQGLTLPDSVVACLEVGAKYWRKQATARELTEAREAAWRSIEGRDRETREPAVAAVRAAICALFPRDWGESVYERLDSFGYFALVAGADAMTLGAALLNAVRPGEDLG